MTKIPPIVPRSDFDKQVLYRSWMQSLPQPEPPATFDASVLKAAKRGTMSHWWGIAVISVFLAVIGGVSMFQSEAPLPVHVVYAPSQPTPLVDLYDLPPVTVEEDARFEHKKTIKKAPRPFGVTGY